LPDIKPSQPKQKWLPWDFMIRAGAKIKHTKSDASGGKVSHLESELPQRFNPRSSGQVTAAFF
jgi:hypothetical protein